MSVKVFYHSADLDGHCSGALVKQAYPEAELFPINYGEAFPWDAIRPGDTVYMVDFSLPPADLWKLNSMCDLRWIDHHKSAIQAYVDEFDLRRGNTDGIRGSRLIGKAACELTWEYLHPDQHVPASIKLLSLYDTWNHDDEHFSWNEDIEPFQYGMKTEETDPSKNWDYWKWFFFNGDSLSFWTGRRDNGKAIMKYLHCRYETELQSRSFSLDWEGFRCLAINSDPYIANYMTRSRAFQGHNLAVNFCRSKGRWIVNLRSLSLDCSEIAKKYGGGGHKGAAGFTCESLPEGWI